MDHPSQLLGQRGQACVLVTFITSLNLKINFDESVNNASLIPRGLTIKPEKWECVQIPNTV